MSDKDEDQMVSTTQAWQPTSPYGNGTPSIPLEAEVPILTVCINDIRTVEYNTEMVSMSAGHPINREINRNIK